MVFEHVFNFVAMYKGDDVADREERRFLCFLINLNILNSRDIVPRNTLYTALQSSLHNLTDKIIDSTELPFLFNGKEIKKLIEEVKNELLPIITPYLVDEQIEECNKMFSFFMDDQMIATYFEKKKWKQTATVASLLRRLWDSSLV